MAKGRLTTHMLDAVAGKPAAGVKILFCRVTGMCPQKIKEAVSNADRRTDAPLLTGGAFVPDV